MATLSTNMRLLGAALVPSLSDREGESTHAALQAEVLALFTELRSPLLRYAMSFGLTLHDAEDMSQEAFLALFRHLQLGRSRENLRSWVFRVTHNLALKRRASLHSERRQAEACSTDDDPCLECWDEAPGPEEQLLFCERQRRLQAVVRALPENDQQCLRLRAEGLRYREIALVVGISLGSVAASLARSFARLERMEAR